MCQGKNNFIFCTCEEKNKNSQNYPIINNYTWILTRFLGVKKSLIRGKIVLPQKKLENGINIINILDQLNNNPKIFDFKYTPNDKDCLELSTSNMNRERKYFKVLYTGGQWIEGSNPAFTTISKIIATGKIKNDTQQSSERT